MKVLIDTNIIIDIFAKREPFVHDSYKVIQLGLEGVLETIMSAGSVTDVYYIIRKYSQDASAARENIFLLSNIIKICSTTPDDITNALILFLPDFEDAVIASIAKREKAEYIITRNEDDFENSPIPAISPAELLKIMRIKKKKNRRGFLPACFGVS